MEEEDRLSFGAGSGDDEYEDIEMVDAEEGELVDPDAANNPGQSSIPDESSKGLKQEKESRNRRRRANKKKNKRRGRSGPEGNVTDVNSFVLETCRRLREKKSYLVYAVVGCLGVSAVNDLVREVDAIRACGGQMTADGRRQRNGGGILRGIIKVREPNAYREIMKRAKEFEKQFKPQSAPLAPGRGNKASSPAGSVNPISEGKAAVTDPEAFDGSPRLEHQNGRYGVEETRKPIKDRIRVPVSYEDIVDDCAEGNIVSFATSLTDSI